MTTVRDLRTRPPASPGRTPDVQRIAKALAGPPETWFAQGTVGVLEEDGTFRTDGLLSSPGSGPDVPEAAYVDPLGMVVDVRLEPEGDQITARYAGIAVGRYGSMLIPLRGGDEVVVAFPGGSLNSGGVIVAVLPNQTAQVPGDWNNDRVLFDLRVPFELRAPAVKLSSPNLVLNGRPVMRTQGGI